MTNEDRHLWKKVAATVKPTELTQQEFTRLRAEIANSEYEHREAKKRLEAEIDRPMKDRPRKYDLPKRRAERQPMPVTRSTLDLHGLTVNDAYRATVEFIEQANKTVTIITGKSGQIRKEFERWVEQSPRVHSCVEKHGGGAFQIRILKRAL